MPEDLRLQRTIELSGTLRELTPNAVVWAEAQSEFAAGHGRALTEPLLAIARSVGVEYPERIRILDVLQLPIPDDPVLQRFAASLGLFGPLAVGLTLGYSVFVWRGFGDSIRLLSHEFRHVYQYEQAGSIAEFIPAYFQQVLAMGYDKAPFEIDARAHEVTQEADFAPSS